LFQTAQRFLKDRERPGRRKGFKLRPNFFDLLLEAGKLGRGKRPVFAQAAAVLGGKAHG